MESKETRKGHDADDNLDKRFGSLDIGHDSKAGIQEGTKGLPKNVDIILAVDLNNRCPAAAFIAPCLGYFQCTKLPVFEGMSESKTASFASFKYNPDSSKPSQFDREWTEDILSHCKALLRMRLGEPLEHLRLQVSFTTRSDTSDRDKAMLAEAAEDAGFCSKDIVQIIPTVEAVTIEAIWDSLVSYANGALKLEDSENILVVHYDGEVADIQSYSISLPAATKGSTESRVRMTEMACGETVDWGKMVDQQFTQWMQDEFGNSFLELPVKETGPNSQLMLEFAKARREYKVKPGDLYSFPLVLKNPPDHASYDAGRHTCEVQDSLMEMFFRSAADSLYESLARHYNTVRTNNMSIKKIIFTGRPGISPYAEQQVMEWGTTWTGILPRGSQALPIGHGRYFRVESTPGMTVRGAIHSNDPDLRMVHRSRACYGVALSDVFENGDPEWSRTRDKFDEIDRCCVRMRWLVKKNQLLDPDALGSMNVHWTFEEDETSCGAWLEVYRCELDDPPRWVRFQENTPDPNMQRVAKAKFEFTAQDFPLGEVKLCNDQVRRRRLHSKVVLSWAHGNGVMRIIAFSADRQRSLGFANFMFPEGRQ